MVLIGDNKLTGMHRRAEKNPLPKFWEEGFEYKKL